jgi:outer membrane immunogenic protein
MKKLFAGLAGLAAVSLLAISANAADLSAPGGYKDYTPAAVWTGFYAGVNGGYGWGQSGQLACGTDCATTNAISNNTPFDGVSPAGWFGGVQLGYNWQGFGYSPLVIGFETDIQASTILGQGADVDGNTYKSRLQAFGTVRGRAGYSMDRALVYFTGGLAYGSIDNEANPGGNAYANSATSVVTGYVLGGGLEYKIKRDLSLKAEYQYINLGKNDPVGASSYTSTGGTVRDDAFNTVRIGLNYFPFAAREPLK